MRRGHGTGSVFLGPKGWMAVIRLAGGRRVARLARSEEAAVAAVEQLIAEYADELGYHYRMPRAVPWGTSTGRRRPVSATTRFRIMERDGWRCVYCGAGAPDSKLVLDHLIPVVDGGSDKPDNLVTACEDCNFGKGDRALLALPPAVSARRMSDG